MVTTPIMPDSRTNGLNLMMISMCFSDIDLLQLMILIFTQDDSFELVGLPAIIGIHAFLCRASPELQT